MVSREFLATLGVEHDRDIHFVVQAPHRIVGVATAVRIGEMVVSGKFPHRVGDDAVEILGVVVELHFGMTIHQALHLIVPQVARSVDADARLEVTLETLTLAKRQQDVIANLNGDTRPEQVGMLEHPASLLDARLDDGLEHASESSGVETKNTALVSAVLADIDTEAVHLVRSEIQDSRAVSVTLTLDGLGVGEVE